MKVGSLVECVDTNWRNPETDTINPVKGKVYTVREIVRYSGETFILLVEIVNKKKHYLEGFYEGCFLIKRFRETQPPIANIEEHINENTLELQEI